MVSGDQRDATADADTARAFFADFKALGVKFDALQIIISAPVWPKRETLNPQGWVLYDLMVDTAKPLALAVAEERFLDAMEIAGTWTVPLNAFVDNTYVADDEEARKLLLVYRHYLDAVASWGRL